MFQIFDLNMYVAPSNFTTIFHAFNGQKRIKIRINVWVQNKNTKKTFAFNILTRNFEQLSPGRC